MTGAASRADAAIKRAMDLIVVALVAMPAAVVLCGCAVMLRAGSGPGSRGNGRGTVYRIVRSGQHGQPIEVLKLRTVNRRGGAFLRRTSLDELPQLWNVVRGEMSVVGPRPLAVEFLERYTPDQRRRLDVKPGLTGWAQLKGHDAPTWPASFEFDVWYVDHRSPWLDVRILAMTALALVVRRRVDNNDHADRPDFCAH